MPVRRLAGIPAFIAGAAIVRGEPTPVVSLSALFDVLSPVPARWVLVRAGLRRVVLAVEAIVGIVELAPEAAGLPPLLSAAPPQTIAALADKDKELLLVLREANLVPEEAWARMVGSGQR
jgi:purine-binding chemotaxis protein CheW